MIIHAFFDESGGGKGDPVQCVAGFVFTSRNARLLSEEWRKMLLRNKRLPFFRMSACNSGREPFDALSKDERIKVQTEAIGLIKKYAAYGVAETTDVQAFHDAVPPTFPTQDVYTFTCENVLVQVLRFIREKHPDVTSTSFFFEAGHANQSKSNAMMKRVFSEPIMKAEYRYSSHEFVEKVQAPPVQAADIIAWQWFKNTMRMRSGLTEPRADCKAVLEVPHATFHYDGPTMQRLFEAAWLRSQERNRAKAQGFELPFEPETLRRLWRP